MSPAALDEPTGKERAASGPLDGWLRAAAYWYLTGLVAALGFSLGFYLVRPASGMAPANRHPLDVFTWQDGKWYKEIASEGYRYNPNGRSNIAFFPVYPLLGRAVLAVTGLRAEAALLIVSNLSLLSAVVALWFYARARYPDSPADLADWVVLAAAAFPTGCFFRLAYSESTFLLLTILAMHAMQRRWPLWGIGLIIGLTTAARAVGVALLAPFAIHIIRIVGVAHREATAERTSRHQALARWGRTSAHLLLCLPLACWGLLAFAAYQYLTFGEPFATAKAHRHWGAPLVWREKAIAVETFAPIRAVYNRGSSAFWTNRDPHGIPWLSLQFANPIFLVLAVVVLAVGRFLPTRQRRDEGFHREKSNQGTATSPWLSLEEMSLGALMLFIPYVTRACEMDMGSMGRFVAVVFPMYLVLGQVLHRMPSPLAAALTGVSCFFLATYTGLYAAGYTIF